MREKIIKKYKIFMTMVYSLPIIWSVIVIIDQIKKGIDLFIISGAIFLIIALIFIFYKDFFSRRRLK